MIGWIPITETRNPFHNPSRTQTPTAIATAVIIVEAAPCCEAPAMYTQATAPEIAATAPTDRSIPRVAMTSVIPSATSSTGAPLRRMSIRLPYRWPSWIRTDRNDGVTTEFSASSSTSASVGQNSGRRTSSRIGGPFR